MRLWKRANRTGLPIARPLWLNYPKDARAAREDQEWMLGRNVLVAPVVEKGAITVTAYFPRGCWRTANGQRFVGPDSLMCGQARAAPVLHPLRHAPVQVTLPHRADVIG